MDDLSFDKKELVFSSVEVTAPSNIAVVKYWGKHGVQIPNNPSISLTLSEAKTNTRVEIIERKAPGFEVIFEGKRKKEFEPKIQTFFSRINQFLPYLNDHYFRITSSNSFPHSSGIASSASAMSALSIALLKMAGYELGKEFYKKHSFLSRLGSGSASRSSYGQWAGWGKNEAVKEMSDLYATPVVDVHENFKDYRDAILIVSAGQKEVSSTAGHGLMDNNPYSARRYQVAHKNIGELVHVLANGDYEQFINLCEFEALQLHALMMCSDPHFVLLRPGTLSIIQEIWSFRKDTGIPLAFTCDAGPNVHILYPNSNHSEVESFIHSNLKKYCSEEQGIIWDKAGDGPEILNSWK